MPPPFHPTSSIFDVARNVGWIRELTKFIKKTKKKTKIVLDDVRLSLFSIKLFVQHFLVD